MASVFLVGEGVEVDLQKGPEVGRGQLGDAGRRRVNLKCEPELRATRNIGLLSSAVEVREPIGGKGAP